MAKRVTKDAREEKRLSYKKCPTCMMTMTTLETPDGKEVLWCINCNGYNLTNTITTK